MIVKLVKTGSRSLQKMSLGIIAMWVVKVGMVYSKFEFFLHAAVWSFCIQASKIQN